MVMKLTLATLFLMTSLAAQGQNILSKTTEDKGYGKRDRVVYEGEQTVMPSQLHEVYGVRLETAATYQISVIDQNDSTKEVAHPTAIVRGFLGGRNLVVGFGAGHSESKAADEDNDFREFQKTEKLNAVVAYTVKDHFTLAAESTGNWASFSQNNDTLKDRNYYGFSHRETAAVSYHDERKEFGVSYTNHIAQSLTPRNGSATASAGFGLARPAADVDRAIYAPAYYTAFARGNFSNNWSGMASIAHVQYDENLDLGSDAFDNYDRRDRLASKVQGVYWMNNRKSNISLTGVYEGGTYAPENMESDAYGYKLANLYGANLNTVSAIADNAYLGIMAGYQSGERDDTVDGVVYKASETRTRIGTSLSVTF